MASIVDAHCHASLRWFEPIETVLRSMDMVGIERAVLVQILREYDNDYLERAQRAHSDRLAIVVGVDAAAADAPDTLARLVERGAKGVRLRTTDRSPGDDPLHIWRVADEFGIAVSCAGSADRFADPAFSDVVEALPGLAIVLEHMAGTSVPDPSDDGRALRERALALAHYPNVMVKVPGLGELSRRALPVSDRIFKDVPPPELLDALRLFGPERMMWASDFPAVSSREGHANAYRGAHDALSFAGAAALDAIFGGTATELFF